MSKKIGLFYGTQTGKTESVAEIIRDEYKVTLRFENNLYVFVVI